MKSGGRSEAANGYAANNTWAHGGAVGLLDAGAGAGAASVERRRVVAQSGALLSAAAARSRLAAARALRPRRPRRPAAVHCNATIN